MFTLRSNEADLGSMLSVDLFSNLLDATAEAPSAEAALLQIDVCRRLLAGPGIFSVQLNVTTCNDPHNQILLQRFYSSNREQFPVQGRKRKTLTPWTETLFARGQVFVAEGSAALELTFDDFEQMRSLGLNAVVNVPLMHGPLCYATFNVFGTCERWRSHQVEAIRLLAVAASRWVRPVADLGYTLNSTETAST